jgi:uncharacterized membrane protein
VRLSKHRLLLRAALLVFLAAFMAWRAHDTGLTAAEPGLDLASARLLARIALVEWVLAGLALLTAGVVGMAMRRGPPRQPLHLDGTPPGQEGPPA